MMQRWIYKQEPSEISIDQISSSLGFGYLASKILVVRGVDNYQKAREFFKPKLSDIHNPFLMKDMKNAVERVASAIENGEKILIFGDYDVDGTSSVALVYTYLSIVYDKKFLDFYIPDRNAEGYGISDESINYAKANGFSLIIALDCGIKSVGKVEYANSLNIDFIICDHHLPGETLPKAVAVLDPKRKDCQYPFKELSGCGVGYKLCEGLNTIYKVPEKIFQDLTDLLVISIAADIVSITGENRVFAKMGLNKLRHTQRYGLKVLIPAERLRNFTISNIVFEIAPKINAAGRISQGKSAVELMIADTEEKAHIIAHNIENLNDERRELDASMTQEALDQVVKTHQESTFTTIVYSPAWNKGVIGIVASRLIESYYRPTLVFTEGNDGELIASARSVSDFDLHNALEICSDLLLKFGGHRAAAGLSIEKEHFDEFKAKFENNVKSSIKEHQKSPSIEIDSIITLDDITNSFLLFHKRLEPFGPGNMKPVFVFKGAKVTGFVRRIGKLKSHLKFFVTQESINKSIECIAFKMEKRIHDFKTKSFDMAFTIEENHWKGNVTHFLNIKDVIFHD